MRYAAPANVSEVTLSIGPVPVVDGFITVPDDLPSGDAGGLSVNGFTPAADAPQSAPASSTASKAIEAAPASGAAPVAASDGIATV